MDRTGKEFALYFMMEGKDYAFRVWPGVPRVGEHVMMHPQAGPTVHEVLEVVWGVREQEEVRGQLTCNVMISTPLPPRTPPVSATPAKG